MALITASVPLLTKRTCSKWGMRAEEGLGQLTSRRLGAPKLAPRVHGFGAAACTSGSAVAQDQGPQLRHQSR
jgi:hypothetical protein